MYINFKKEDHQKNFKKLNILFGYNLPDIDIEIKHTKKAGGTFKVMLYKNVEISKKIFLSDYFKITRQEYNNILAHEMIHYYLYYNNIEDKNHGINFKNEMKNINSKFGFNIETFNDVDISNVQVNKNTKQKRIAVIIDNAGVIVFNDKCKKEVDTFFKSERFQKRNIKIIETFNPNINVYPVKRKITKSIVSYQIPLKLIDELINE